MLYSIILNVHVATMTTTKSQLNPTYGSGGDSCQREMILANLNLYIASHPR